MADSNSKAIKGALNAALSSADMSAGRAMDRLAKSVPKDSFLRTEVAGTLFGALRGLVETAVSFNNPLAEVLKEKAVDYLDFFSQGLYRKNSGAEKEIAKGSTKDWVGVWLEKAKKRIAEAEDIQEEQTRLSLEFEAIQQIVRLIDDVLSPTTDGEPDEEDEDLIDLKSELRGIAEWLRRTHRNAEKSGLARRAPRGRIGGVLTEGFSLMGDVSATAVTKTIIVAGEVGQQVDDGASELAGTIGDWREEMKKKGVLR